MQASFVPVMRDYLVRFQRTAIKETGRRPVFYVREPMDDELVMPGCQIPGYAFWQPVAWPGDTAPLGANAKLFHVSIRDYLSMCQFAEMGFRLPVAPMSSKLNFLYKRTFLTYRNTVNATPERAFNEALLYHREHADIPLHFCMAATCDGSEPLLMCLRAQDGQAFIQPVGREIEPLYLNATVDRLLPKLQFAFEK